MTETQVQPEVNSCEIRGEQNSDGTVFSPSSFGVVTLPGTPPLRHTHKTSPRKACDIPHQAALPHYILGPKVGGFRADIAVGWLRSKDIFNFSSFRSLTG
jgi:hypothetical protein